MLSRSDKRHSREYNKYHRPVAQGTSKLRPNRGNDGAITRLNSGVHVADEQQFRRKATSFAAPVIFHLIPSMPWPKCKKRLRADVIRAQGRRISLLRQPAH
jgi:hypothetical protein